MQFNEEINDLSIKVNRRILREYATKLEVNELLEGYTKSYETL